MHKNIIFIVAFLALFACQEEDNWKKVNEIDLGEVTPIGMAASEGSIWISDGDNNRLVRVSPSGQVELSLDGFERPMHIAVSEAGVYIPEYGLDQITLLQDTTRSQLAVSDSLDAPAAVSVFGKEIAIADFYNNRILYYNGNAWISIGESGKEAGQFSYPTDVQITSDQIVVADAYNNRIQVFDKSGKHLSIIGDDEGMNAATGLFVSETSIFITDFENDRVLAFDMNGKHTHTIEEGLEKPTDIILMDDLLYIANYKGKSLTVYQK